MRKPTVKRLDSKNLRRLIEQNFDVIRDRSNDVELVIICPEAGCPDQTGNRSINLERGVTNCWRCSGANGHVFHFLRRHGVDFGIEDLSAKAALDDLIDPVAQIEADLTGGAKLSSQPVRLPRGFTLCAEEPVSVYTRLIERMAWRKRLYIDDFNEAGVGFTRVDALWEPYAIFPVYELGRLVYYQGRTYSAHREGKGSTKRFPAKTEVPAGAGHWVYNYDAALRSSTKILMVVESILNVLSLKRELKRRGWDQEVVPVAVFKHKISSAQWTKLAVSPAAELCFVYDSDATAASWDEASKLCGSKQLTITAMPPGVDANDDAVVAVDQFTQRQAYSPAAHLAANLGL